MTNKKILVVGETPSMGDILRKAAGIESAPVKYDVGTVEVVVMCDSHEIEKIIEKEYGFKEYSIVASEEIGNYVSMEFTVDGEVGDPEDIEDRKEMYMTREYLNDLARQNKIQKGKYVVDCSW